MPHFLDFTAVFLDQTFHVDICNKDFFFKISINILVQKIMLLVKYKENPNSVFYKLFFLSITYFRCLIFIHLYFNPYMFIST